jgi:hypothetical protein
MATMNRFECRVIDQAQEESGVSAARPNADDALLRTFRLAMSVTGEYTAYFGGTKALALAAINNTMTRVNGVFEKDFSARMVLIANTDTVIYTSASTDPYSAAATGSGGAWNQELQTTLTNNIGNANYDIGHLFGASGGGGNAGCIGCICTNPTASVPLGKVADSLRLVIIFLQATISISIMWRTKWAINLAETTLSHTATKVPVFRWNPEADLPLWGMQVLLLWMYSRILTRISMPLASNRLPTTSRQKPAQ